MERPGRRPRPATWTAADVDNPNDDWTAVVTAITSDSGYGTYTLTAAGVWSYTLDDTNAAVQALNVGDTLTDTFTASTVDGTSQLVTITIHGANDAAVITGPATGAVTEAGGVANGTAGTPTATGDLNFDRRRQSERRLDGGQHGDRERQWLRQLYAQRRRRVDLHAG